MKPFLLILGMVYAGLWGVACKSEATPQQNTSPESTSPGTASRSTSLVALNNGERWQANRETTEGIAAMRSILESASAPSTLEEYEQLHDKLETELNLIFKRCTMIGEAHNQLHHYLLPLKTLLEGLDSGDLATCAKNKEKLHKHLAMYDTYFQ